MKKNQPVNRVSKQIVVWWYMKILYLWKGNELFEINFEFKWKKPANKGSSTMAFVMLNRFGLLSKETLLPLFLSDNIWMDGMLTNIKLKIKAYLTLLYFKLWEGTSVKSYNMQLSGLLFLVLHLFLYQQISYFFTAF